MSETGHAPIPRPAGLLRVSRKPHAIVDIAAYVRDQREGNQIEGDGASLYAMDE